MCNDSHLCTKACKRPGILQTNQQPKKKPQRYINESAVHVTGGGGGGFNPELPPLSTHSFLPYNSSKSSCAGLGRVQQCVQRQPHTPPVPYHPHQSKHGPELAFFLFFFFFFFFCNLLSCLWYCLQKFTRDA